MGFISRSQPDLQSLYSDAEDTEAVTSWTPGKAEYLIMITIATISLMVALDATILVPVLPELAISLHGSSTDAFWAGTSYLLTSAVFQPFIAALSDVFGRQQLLMLAVFLFFLGTLLCALANDFTVLLAGRTVQGIGGGGIITMGGVIFADIIPLRQRPKWFALVLGAWALGSVLGPLVGGLFVQHLNWRWVFYINFPFCLAGFIMVPLFVKLNKTHNEPFMTKIKRVDWIGGFMFIGSITSFLIGVSWAGVQYKWKSIQVIVPIVVGAVGTILSLVWEVKYANEPFIRASLFYNSSVIAAFYCALAQGCLLFTGLYYAPFYFMSVRGSTPVQAGLNLFPVTCLLLPGSILVSLITTRIGRFRWALWTGWTLTTLGCGLLYLLDLSTPTPLWATIFAIFGVGNGMVLTSVNFGIQSISRTRDCGRAASMYAFMRSLGMTLGVAIGGTAFQNVMADHLGDLGLPAQIAHESEAFIARLHTMAESDPVRHGVLEAYVQGFKGVWIIMMFVAATGALASGVVKKFSMDKILVGQFSVAGAKGQRRWGDGASEGDGEGFREKGYYRKSIVPVYGDRLGHRSIRQSVYDFGRGSVLLG